MPFRFKIQTMLRESIRSKAQIQDFFFKPGEIEGEKRVLKC